MRTNGYRTKRITQFMGVLLSCILTVRAWGGVNVGVDINIGPPPIVVPTPPEVVLIPNYGVYFVPGLGFDVFFHNGYWWSPRGDRWYRAEAYNGPWRGVERRFVPRTLIRVPRDYRAKYVRERHIPYGEWRERHFRGERRGEFRESGERREHGRGHEHER